MSGASDEAVSIVVEISTSRYAHPGSVIAVPRAGILAKGRVDRAVRHESFEFGLNPVGTGRFRVSVHASGLFTVMLPLVSLCSLIE